MSEQRPIDNGEPGDSFTPGSLPPNAGNGLDRGALPSPHPLSGPNWTASQRALAFAGNAVSMLLVFSIVCVGPYLINLGAPFAPEIANRDEGPLQTWQERLWFCSCVLIVFAAVGLVGYADYRFLRRIGVELWDPRYWRRPYFDGLRESRERSREAQGLGRSPFGEYDAAQLARQRDNLREAVYWSIAIGAFLAAGLIAMALPLGISRDAQLLVGSSITGLSVIAMLRVLWLSSWRR